MNTMPRFPTRRALARVLLLAAAAGALGGCEREGRAAQGTLADAEASADPAANAAPARTPADVADVVQAWPHDPNAFTQGLVWHEGRMFEGTGQEGKSNIRETELQTGRVIRKRDLDKKYFGEGIVILGDKLYQITWTSERAFVYDWRTFEPTGEQFTYEGEGWGLATDGTSLIMSNGTSSIVYRDPKTFAVTRQFTVTDKGQPVTHLNELEWVKGELWANVWQSDQIARIDPATGNVTAWLDLAGLLPKDERTGNEDVLNGIAYDAVGDRVFVTGKLWAKLYEIRLRQRS